MKLFAALAVLSVALAAVPAQANPSAVSPTLPVEKQIAAAQGRFGALYARCASADEQDFIGGSLSAWRQTTFAGYMGNRKELAAVEKSFDDAAATVTADSCQDWVAQAAASWQNAMHLAQGGAASASY